MTTITNYTKKQKNAFIKKHDLANLLPELDKAITFDLDQLLHRNSAEINRTLRIAALRSESDRLTELGQQVLHYVLAVVEGVKWDNGRIALGKKEVTIKTDLVFTVYIEEAKAKAEKDAKDKAEKAEKEKAEKAEKAKAAAQEKAEKAAAAKAKADDNKADEVAQAAAATAIFEAKAADSKLIAGDRNMSAKTLQNALHSLIAGNAKFSTLQDINDTFKLLQLAQQALARYAKAVPNVDVDEDRVEELSKTKPTGKEKTAPKKKTG
ncbi:MAG TPA: hypothetical protein VFC74_05865 [Oscillospiraceae bacterium]|nr:hypothetical protein [Oscillospiraceae bacterium]